MSKIDMGLEKSINVVQENPDRTHDIKSFVSAAKGLNLIDKKITPELAREIHGGARCNVRTIRENSVATTSAA